MSFIVLGGKVARALLIETTMPVTSPGLKGIVAATTRLSDVRGEEGVLIYAGYDINELAGRVSYEEVVYLLWHDRLPNKSELAQLKTDLKAARALPEPVVEFLKNAPKDANVMDVLRTGVSMLGLYDHAPIGPQTTEELLPRAISLTAKVSVIVAYFHRARQGKSLPPIRSDLDEAAHFLYLLSGDTPGPEAVATLDMAYVLHADHGFNASTFSALVTIATLSDIYSAVTTAIGSLKGPLHGGANEAVMHMLLEIAEPARAKPWLLEALRQKRLIMGFGHRVYKHGDSRVPTMKKYLRATAAFTGETKWLEMEDILEATMLELKQIHPNLDFPSGPAYYMMGFEVDMFTPFFVMARITGWTAHIMEQLAHNRLIRPLSEYTGPGQRAVVPLSQRV